MKFIERSWFINYTLYGDLYLIWLTNNILLVFYQRTQSVVRNSSHNRIGHRCEYEIDRGSTTSSNWIHSQICDRLTAFVDNILCERGSSFVEWRHISDEITQCHHGTDELRSHLLQFHSCGSDGYRCRVEIYILLESYVEQNRPGTFKETSDIVTKQRESSSCLQSISYFLEFNPDWRLNYVCNR